MAPRPNRKRHAVEAPDERWKLLGELLQARRMQLGHKYRTTFAAERLPLTDAGNPNVRLAADIEMSYRPGRYPAGTLRQIAAAYAVTWESFTAVLRGGADGLAPASEPGPGALPPSPMAPGREAAARPWADRIWERLVALRDPDPPGARLFPGAPADARTWDGTAGRMGLAERVWLIADMQRRDDGGRGGASEAAGA